MAFTSQNMPGEMPEQGGVTVSANASVKQVAGERLLTVKEAAASLGMCVDSVRRHLRSGKLEGVRVGGTWRVSESKLALHLGLLATSAVVPGLDAFEERKHNRPGMTVTASRATQGDKELVDMLMETPPVKARVLRLVEAAALKVDLPASVREQLAREVENALSNSNDAMRD